MAAFPPRLQEIVSKMDITTRDAEQLLAHLIKALAER
jgi:hypothetical protein